MKFIICIFIGVNLLFSFTTKVILCKDLYGLNNKIKLVLHLQAEERAKKEAENFMEKRIIIPFPDLTGKESNISVTSHIIETFWCLPNMPLHEAWYHFYMKNKWLWKK